MSQASKKSQPGMQFPNRLGQIVRITVLTAIAMLLMSADATERSSQQGNPPPLIYSTDIGGLTKVMLKDGSQVLLGTSTTFRVEPGSNVRQGELVDGEILLQVREMSERPYALRAGPLAIECPGGQVNVRQRDGALIVNQLTGKSVIRPAERAGVKAREFKDITLDAGKRVELRGGVLIVSEFDPEEVERELKWRDGKLAFVDEPIERVVEEFNRYNRVKLVVSDPGVAGFRIGGTFQATDVDGLVTSLEKLGEPKIRSVPVDNPDGTRSVLLVIDKKS